MEDKKDSAYPTGSVAEEKTLSWEGTQTRLLISLGEIRKTLYWK